jgi:hypothetical protein
MTSSFLLNRRSSFSWRCLPTFPQRAQVAACRRLIDIELPDQRATDNFAPRQRSKAPPEKCHSRRSEISMPRDRSSSIREGHRLGSRQRESSISQQSIGESELLRSPHVEEMREHADYFRVFCRERGNRGLAGGDGWIRTPETLSATAGIRREFGALFGQAKEHRC